MSKSAASFIDQIKASYQEVVKAESGALPHAIRCGEFLTLAKENLKAEKGGKWLDWLDTNCKEIARETASLYMRLAEHKAKLGKARSIAEARKLLPKAKPRGRPQTPPPQPDPPSDNEPTFEDEVEVRAPDELFAVLVEHWEDQELEQLVKLIGDHLTKKKLATQEISTGRTNPVPAVPSPTSSAMRRTV
jgi:hypothetical protein